MESRFNHLRIIKSEDSEESFGTAETIKDGYGHEIGYVVDFINKDLFSWWEKKAENLMI
ncbi:hypothetical protein ABE174_19565 [Bacillus subtilis]